MSRKYKFENSSELFFTSFAVINWIDLFIRKNYKGLDSVELYFLKEGTSETLAPDEGFKILVLNYCSPTLG